MRKSFLFTLSNWLTDFLKTLYKSRRKNHLIRKFVKTKQGVIVLKSSDRQLGLSTMLLTYCLDNNCILYVPGRIGRTLAHDFFMYRSAHHLDCPNPSQLLKQYIITSDNPCAFQGIEDREMILNNSCTPLDLGRVLLHVQKVRGFITCDFISL